MRNTLYLLLAAAGLVGLAALLARRGRPSRRDPTREVERLLDRCRELLDGIESAARSLDSSEPSPS
ncbi:MAG TPA: hypothetical protein PLU39_19210 [Armatimonadota bacterium]|jgi:DNA-binding transcriptional LysR family regulator|nr:hypothetical protein [Armatimonadota bacterium]HOJ21617.1 hypothetical protein [Armatimonadota bacterium]HOM82936.1 hypothetical protein [Armatimonadota bacterium]HPO72565.1 hypothetical protein [Armatimonadota bacterium]HPT99999.1 hypothetical protein [Armatimonadota bacterium]